MCEASIQYLSVFSSDEVNFVTESLCTDRFNFFNFLSLLLRSYVQVAFHLVTIVSKRI